MVLIPNTMCNNQQPTIPRLSALKTGYLDIKQHSKVRPRKLKTWRRRWAVLTQMSNLSSNEYVAKLDLYDNETKWQSNCSDKMTFVLENVTGVQQTKSTTHQYAFEVVERQPVLVMSGFTLEESYSWILALQQIFLPEEILASKGDFRVTVSSDEHSGSWNLAGEFTVSISPACISLRDLEGRHVVTWALNTLKRFRVEKCPVTGQKSILVIESGPNSPTGQTCLRFQSDDSDNIMCAIKQSVSLAVALKEQTGSIVLPRSRKLGITRDDRSLDTLLNNQAMLSSVRNGSCSESSSSTTNQKSPSVKHSVPADPVPYLISNLQSEETLHSETGQKVHSCNALCKYNGGCMCEIFATNEHSLLKHKIRSSETMKDRFEIKSTMAEQGPMTDNHSLTCESPEIDVRRLRSVSTVVAAMKARYGQESWRFESPNNDKTTDIDSAISSMISAPNDDLLWMDMQHCRDFDLNENLSSRMPHSLTLQGELATQDAFEHEYEELDELDAALRKIHQDQDPDTPPALPARPPSIGCTSYTAHAKVFGVNTRSLFKRTEKWNSHETNTRTRGHLSHVNVEMSCAAPGHTICDACGGESSKRESKCLTKSPSTERLILNSCSCVNAANELLPDTTCARCSSSDITPEKPLYFRDEFTTDTVSQTSNIQLHGRELQVSTRSRPCIQNLTNRRETRDRPEAETVKPTLMTSAVYNTQVDPLISFSLDNANFAVNPCVTGELTTIATSLSNGSETFTLQSISASVLANDTPAVCNLKPESRPHSKAHHYDNGFDIFDCWSIGHMGNDETVNLPKISFAGDQNQKVSDSTYVPQNVPQYTQNDYIAMADNSDSWCRKAATNMNGMRNTATFLADGLEKLAFPGAQTRDTYVQPNHTASLVKQCQQFRNVY